MIKKIIFLSFWIIIIACNAFGQELTFNKRMSYYTNNLSPVLVGDNADVLSPGVISNYTDDNIQDFITLGIEHEGIDFVSDPFQLEVDVLITPVNQANTPINITLQIDYFPFKQQAYRDRDTYLFTNISEYNYKISAIRVDGTPVNELPVNVYLDGNINLRRYYDFSQSLLNNTDVIGVNQPGVHNLDAACSANLSNDEIEITWQTKDGAIEYQLEWVFINDYKANLYANPPTYSNLSPGDIYFDFKYNSTRITTVHTSYKIPVLFTKGYFLYRVRAVGETQTTPVKYVYGSWNTLDKGLVSDFIANNPSNYVYISEAHERDKNWQVTTTFAEEGKKKEVASYYDGSLRNRQSVTVVNTNNNIIVGETVYDHQGRPAVNILPVPVQQDNCNAPVIKYYPDFNKNENEVVYSKSDFDDDGGNCVTPNPNPMSTSSGASRYYSENNIDKTDEQAYVPDAKGYPFTVVEYTPDNTGRIRRQSGVGPDFQFNSDHETKYFYGKPDQIQLDRLFASEVGYAEHYKKNMVVDPNGQISVSYLDQEGRVIATSLAGDNPSNLEAIDSYANSEVHLNEQMIANTPENTTALGNVNQIEFSQSILVTNQTQYDFVYDFTVDNFHDECMAADICFSCVYDLTISLTNDCGQPIEDINGVPVTYQIREGHFVKDASGNFVAFALDCNNNPYNYHFEFSAILPVGNYNLVKNLSISNEATQAYVDYYFETQNGQYVNTTCLSTFDDYLQNYMGQIDYSACNIDCETCAQSLGTREDYIAQGRGSGEEWDALYQGCMEACQEPTQCELAYDMMLEDMSPGGQYGKYLDGQGNIDASSFPLSIYNPANRLPELSSFWTAPAIFSNGSITSDYYRESDGSISYIHLYEVSNGVYQPSISGTPTIMNGEPYALPTQLTDLEDFTETFWRDSWAKSLLVYHPEYCYYQQCIEFEKEGTNGISSQDFDAQLRASTFATAINKGWLVPDPDTQADPNGYILNLNAFNDPALDPGYVSYNASVANQLNYYLTINHQEVSNTQLTTLQLAAFINNCATTNVGLSTLSPSCTYFGTNLAIQDDEWTTFVALYLSKKDGLMADLFDANVMADWCINDCIGEDHYNPFQQYYQYAYVQGNPFNWPLYYSNVTKPCTQFRYFYYKNKQKRFPAPQDISFDQGNSEYQMYELTGLCPVAFDFNQLLSRFAQNGLLTGTTTTSINNLAEFDALYLAATFNDNSPVPVSTADFSVSGNILTIDMQIGGTAPYDCQTTLNTDGLIIDWSTVTDLTGLQPLMDLGGGQYQFSVNATTVDINGTVNHITLTGQTCMDIINCQFPEQCQPSDLALDLQLFLSGLQSDGSSNISVYQPLYTSRMENLIGGFNSLSINQPSQHVFTLSSTLGTLELDFTSFDHQGSYTFADVVYFDNINSNNQNYFTLEGYTVNGDLAVTIGGAAYFTATGGTKEPFELGSCDAPVSYACDNEGAHNLQDLYNLLSAILVDGQTNLTGSPDLTTSLMNYFGDASQTNQSNGALTFINADGSENACGFTLTPQQGYDLSSMQILSLVSILPTGSLVNNYYYNFTLTVSIDDGNGGTTNVDLYGTSCVPLRSCVDCHDNPATAAAVTTQLQITNLTITKSYSTLQQSYQVANSRMGLSPGNPGYITPPDLTTSLMNGNEIYFAALSRYATNFNPNYDNVALLKDFSLFITKYSQIVNVTCELAKYKAVVANCNSILDSTNHVACICDSSFTYGRYAEAVGKYSLYVDSVLAQGDTTVARLDTYAITNNLVKTTIITDPCVASYNNYVSLWMNYWQQLADNQTMSGSEIATCKFLNPLLSFTEFDSICTGNCSSDLDNYVNSFTNFTVCPQKPIFSEIVRVSCSKIGCDTIYGCLLQFPRPPLLNCDYYYQMYSDAITTYNSSNYATTTGITLPLLPQNSSYCSCYQNYLDYIYAYIASNASTNMPAPVGIDQFNCQSPCYLAVVELNTQIQNFNSSPYAQYYGVTMDPVDPGSVTNCNCINSYISCLSVYTGLKSNQVASVNLPSPLPYSDENCGNCCGGQIIYSGAGNPNPEGGAIPTCVPIETECDQLYRDYVNVVTAFNNNFTATGQISTTNEITLLSKHDFLVNGLCDCAPAYNAFIQSILDGNTAIPQDNMELMIANHCVPTPCAPDPFDPETVPIVTVPYVNPCEENMDNAAYNNALNAYKEYVDSITQQLIENYTSHCIDALNESFTKQYSTKEHHYTLYYYDQAGNLVKTVPPEGVEFVPVDAINDPNGDLENQIQDDRNNSTQTVFTNHHLETKYAYNSLNQLVKQSLPDHDQMEIIDYTLVNGLDANLVITEIDYANASFGLLSGYKTETLLDGSTVDRGYLYKTTDGGQTWNKLYNIVASDIKAIQYVNNNLAFAVGNDGLLLKSVDGGNSWDMIDLYSYGVNVNLNDLWLDQNGNGFLVGDNHTIISYNNGTTPTINVVTMVVSSTNPIYSLASSDRITSISYNANTSEYALSMIKNHNGNDFGALYTSTDGTNWTAIENNFSKPLNSVDLSDANKGFIAGNNGLLLQTDDGGDNWFVKATNLNAHINQVYFLDDQKGVAIANSVLYQTQDGGNTFTILDNTRSYLSLTGYFKDANNAYAFATCQGTEVVRVILSATSNAVIDPENAIGLTANVNSSWAENNAGTLPVMIATSGNIYFTGNYNMTNPTWLSIPTSGITPGVKKLRFTKTGSDYHGVLINSTGQLYSFNFTGTGAIAPSLIGSTDNYSDIFFDASSNIVYAYNINQRRLDQVDILTGTLTQGVVMSSFNPNSYVEVSKNGNSIQLVSTGGQIVNYSTSETDQSFHLRPLPLNALTFDNNNNTVTAGNNGDFCIVNSGNGEITSSSTLENLNGIIATPNASIAVGNNGVIVNHANNGTISVNNTITNNDLYAIDYNPTCHCAVTTGENGTKITFHSGNITVIPSSTATSLYAAALNDNGVFSTGGNQSKMEFGSGSFAMENHSVYAPLLRDVSAYDVNRFAVSGTHYFARRTTTGANIWSAIVPKNSDMSGYNGELYDIKEYANQTIIAGENGYYKTIDQTTNAINAASSPFASGVTIKDVEILSDGSGIVVGVNGATGYAQSTSDGGQSWTNVSGVLNPQSNAYAFDHNSTFISVGDAGSMYYYDGGVASSSNFSSGTTENLTDIDFYDDAVGYVTGLNGTLQKTDSYNWNNPTDRKLTSLSMTVLPLDDVTGIQPNNTSKNINTIGVVSRDNIFVGGVYDPTSSSEDYARILKDEAEEFSTYFYYDKLGRIVVSQNSRQYAEAIKKYSYTLYDALGRVVEAGEKEENQTAGGFETIFGSIVSDYYNPKVIDDLKLQAWISGDGTRRQVTRSYYDDVNPDIQPDLPSTFVQNTLNLRKRISAVTYEDVYDGVDATYAYATHYDYDIHGNVKSLLQDNQNIESFSNNQAVQDMRFKRMDYDYDLISGNVNEVSYQKGQPDQWHHRYTYDADNRIQTVETSDDYINWDEDIRYFYYDHGPLARVELGEHNVQGTDYAYTLQGWLKGVNSDVLNPANDIGKDGALVVPMASSGANKKFARDAFGFSLNYFSGDYSPVETSYSGAAAFNSDIAGSDVAANKHDLYNGNIGAMVTTIKKPMAFCDPQPAHPDVFPQATAYQYDQLNRLKEARAFDNLDSDNQSSTYNTWLQGTTNPDSRYFNTFSYDANGNIESQTRKDQAGNTIDELTYHYATVGGKKVQNRLYHVNDNFDYDDNDIDNMLNNNPDPNQPDPYAFINDPQHVNEYNNYSYDPTGQLIRDKQEQIANIIWRVDGKISAIIREQGSLKKNMIFEYDPMGNRIAKHIYGNQSFPAGGGNTFDPNNPSADWEKTTYYNRDAQGNVMAIYEYKVDNSDPQNVVSSFMLSERNIYGSSRVGMNKAEKEMIGATLTVNNHIYHKIGDREYELSNHLGNVLSLISDRKFAVDENGDLQVDYYEPDVLLTYDYSPFGVILTERNFTKQVAKDTLVDVTIYTENDDFSTNTAANYIPQGNASVSITANQTLAVTGTSSSGGGTNNGNSGGGNNGTGNGNGGGNGNNGQGNGSGSNSGNPQNTPFGITKTLSIPVAEDYTFSVDVTNHHTSILQVKIKDDAGNVIYTAHVGAGASATVQYNFTTTNTQAVNYSLELVYTNNNGGSGFEIDNLQVYYITQVLECVTHDYSAYRYGFNGMEKDDEIKGAGNSYNFKYRMHDPRLGRFFAIDPLFKKYPYLTPYQFSSNSPISMIELEGLEGVHYVDHANKTTTIKLDIYYAPNPENYESLTDEQKKNYSGFTEAQVQEIKENLMAQVTKQQYVDENNCGEDGEFYDVNFEFNFIPVTTLDEAKEKRAENKEWSSSIILVKKKPVITPTGFSNGSSHRGITKISSEKDGHSIAHEIFHNLVHFSDNVPEDNKEGQEKGQRYWHNNGKYGGGIFKYGNPQENLNQKNVQDAINHTKEVPVPPKPPKK